MTNLLDALLNADTNETREVFIKRLGTKVTVKEITVAQFNEAKEAAVTVTGKGKKAKQHVNEAKMGAVIVSHGVVDNPFTNAELMTKVGAMDPVECVEKTLKVGEIITLMSEILELSGFDGNGEVSDELIEEAKN